MNFILSILSSEIKYYNLLIHTVWSHTEDTSWTRMGGSVEFISNTELRRDTIIRFFYIRSLKK